jgi:hypothetical protein
MVKSKVVLTRQLRKIVKKRGKKNGLGTRVRNTRRRAIKFSTIANVERAFATARAPASAPSSSMMGDKGFIHCRLNPFESSNGVGLNDGSLMAKIVYDSKIYADISSIESTVSILILPWMPACAGISGVCTVAQGNQTSTSIGLVNNTLTYAWYPILMQGAQNNGAIQIPEAESSPPIQAGKARLLTQGYRLIYTGPANTCSGLITVSSSSANIVQVLSETNTSGLGSAANPYSSFILQPQIASTLSSFTAPTAIAGTSMPLGTNMPVVNVAANFANYSPETVTYRPEVGCSGVLRHATRNYEFNPISELNQCPIQTATQLTTTFGSTPYVYNPAFFTTLNATAQTNQAMPNCDVGNFSIIYWWDNDWQPVSIQISGASSTATYRLEVVQCFEFIPEINSAFRPLAKISGVDNSNHQRIADMHLANQPIAIPANQRIPMPSSRSFIDDLGDTALHAANVAIDNAPVAVKLLARMFETIL